MGYSELMRLKFRRPPLDELVVASYFQPVQPLQSQHVGLFWASVIDRFPKCTQSNPVRDMVQFEDEPFPMPRFWLISDDDAYLVQIQKTAFIANWRRRVNGSEYESYEGMKKFFYDNFSRFRKFTLKQLGAEVSQPSHLELSYINFLTTHETESLEGLVGLVPGIGPLKIPSELGAITGFTAAYSVNVAADLILQINVGRAVRADDSREGLRLEIRAIGIPDPPEWDAASLWFDRAHDHIGGVFLSLVSEAIQKSWEPLHGDAL